MKIPEKISNIMAHLIASGYKAYIIGGAVRDYYIGIEPHDYDIFTNCAGDNLLNLFPDGKVLGGKVVEVLKTIIAGQCEQMDLDMLALEVMPDRIHLFVGAKPKHTPWRIIKQLKGNTSIQLRRCFKHLPYLLWNYGKRFPHLWAKGYYCGNGWTVDVISHIFSFIPRLEETSKGRTSIPPTNKLAGILEVIL